MALNADLQTCRISSMLSGHVTLFVSNISLETSQEAVWGWLKRATGRTCHTIYFNQKGGAVAVFSSLSDTDYARSHVFATKNRVDGNILNICVAKKTTKITIFNLPYELNMQQLLANMTGAVKVEDLSKVKAYKYDEDTSEWASTNYIATSADEPKMISHNYLQPKSTIAMCLLVFHTEGAAATFHATKFSLDAQPLMTAPYFEELGPVRACEIHSFKDFEGLDQTILTNVVHEDPIADKDRVLLSNIGTATQDSVKYFVEGLCGVTVKNTKLVKCYNESQPRFLFQFKQPINYRQFCQLLNSTTLDKMTLQPSQYRAEDTAIIVKGFPPGAVKDKVESYFQGTRRLYKIFTGDWVVVFKNEEDKEIAEDNISLYKDYKTLPFEEFREVHECRQNGHRTAPFIALDSINQDVLRYVLEFKNNELKEFARLHQASLTTGLAEIDGLKEMPSMVLSVERTNPSYADAVNHWVTFRNEIQEYFSRYSVLAIPLIHRILDYLQTTDEFKQLNALASEENADFKILIASVDSFMSSNELKVVGAAHIAPKIADKICELEKNATEHLRTVKEKEQSRLCGYPDWFLHLFVERRQQYLADCEDVKIEVNLGQQLILVEGFPLNVAICTHKIEELWRNHVEDDIVVSQAACYLLKKPYARSSMVIRLKGEDLDNQIKWYVKDDTVCIRSFDTSSAQKASRIIKQALCEASIPTGMCFEDEAYEEFDRAVRDIEETNGNWAVIGVTDDGKEISCHAACLKEDWKNLEIILQNNLEHLVKRGASFPLPPALAMYVERRLGQRFHGHHFERDTGLFRIEDGVNRHQIRCKILGNAKDISELSMKVLEMLSGATPVQTKTVSIEAPEVGPYFDQNAKLLIEIGNETTTAITVNHPDCILNLDNSTHSIVASAILPRNVHISVVFGNIELIKCDAIVNSVEPHLNDKDLHSERPAVKGCRDDGLEHKVSEDIRKQLIQNNICIKEAEHSLCKSVIHVLYPQWQLGCKSKEQDLCETMFLILSQADNHNLAHICLPALGYSKLTSGFTSTSCAKAIFESLSEYFANSNGSIKQVTVVATDTDILNSFTILMQPSTSLVSRAEVLNKEMNFGAPITINNVLIELLRGSIANIQADAILNALTLRRNENFGESANDIFKAAGPQLLENVRQLARENPKPGGVFVTSNGSLKCKHVINVSMANWDGSYGTTMVTDAVMRGLRAACDLGSSTIAIPAFGVSTHGYPSEESAIQVARAVVAFCTNAQTTVTHLKVVAFGIPLLATIFGDRLIKEINYVTSKDAKDDCMSADYFAELPGKRITMRQFEAELCEGDITEEKCGAIVCPNQGSIDWQGDVAQALRSKAGQSVITECEFTGSVHPDTPFVSSSGRLSCGKIIHVSVANGVFAATKMCLEKAQQMGIHSISLPPLVTDEKNVSAQSAAFDMMQAVSDVAKQDAGRRILKVRIVVRDKNMLHNFSEAMRTASADIERFLSMCEEQMPSELTFKSSVPYLKLDICGTLKHIEDAETRLFSVCNAEIGKNTRELIEESLQSLSTAQIKELVQMAESCDMGMKIELAQSKLTLWTMNASHLPSFDKQVRQRIREMERQNVTDQISSMKFKWQVKFADGSWHTYNYKTNLNLEKCFQRGKNTYLHRINGKCYMVDIATKRCHLQCDPTQSFEIRRLSFENEIPNTWELTKSYSETTLSEESVEWRKVAEKLRTEAKQALRILKITRIENVMLYQQYLIQKRKISEGMHTHDRPVEMILWHGTGEEYIETICRQGFSRSFTRRGLYGLGVYFAKHAHYSISPRFAKRNKNGEQHIMYCQVATGEFCDGENEAKYTKCKENSAYAPYDSTVGEDETIFAVYNDAQAYPAYVVKFMLSN